MKFGSLQNSVAGIFRKKIHLFFHNNLIFINEIFFKNIWVKKGKNSNVIEKYYKVMTFYKHHAFLFPFTRVWRVFWNLENPSSVSQGWNYSYWCTLTVSSYKQCLSQVLLLYHISPILSLVNSIVSCCPWLGLTALWMWWWWLFVCCCNNLVVKTHFSQGHSSNLPSTLDGPPMRWVE